MASSRLQDVFGRARLDVVQAILSLHSVVFHVIARDIKYLYLYYPSSSNYVMFLFLFLFFRDISSLSVMIKVSSEECISIIFLGDKRRGECGVYHNSHYVVQ